MEVTGDGNRHAGERCGASGRILEEEPPTRVILSPDLWGEESPQLFFLSSGVTACEFGLNTMTDQDTAQTVVPMSVRLWRGIRKAALSVLFAAIMVIPGVRRLRRKIWEWSVVRILVASVGCLLGWRYKHANGGIVDLVVGVALMAFGLLVRAKPEAKSVDAQARELDALVVLNGGAFIPAGNERPSRLVTIFVNPDRLFVVDEHEHTLEEIPLVRVRELAARPVPVSDESEAEAQTWDLAITWESKDIRTARFRYDGFFAEHLARVAETTVRNLLRRELPVLRE
jgi:hypothetical protein